jgi:sugar phosphate isomerase/epimerase
MKAHLSRREFLNRTGALGVAAALAPALVGLAASGAAPRKFKLCLAPGSVGIKVPPREVIALAVKHGFEAVEPNAAFLMSLSDSDLSALLDEMKAANLVFGATNPGVDFRGDEAKFQADMKGLPKLAAALQRAGAQRVRTWIVPGHNDLTYEQNFQQHARRLREIARVLKDHGLKFGLEYVGPVTARNAFRHPFIYSMAETRKLIAEIGTGNVGYVLDTFLWWTAGETETELLSLQGSDVVAVDLSDAPKGIPRDEQIDQQRELPCATGVIPTAAFMNALQKIGYDGPARAEPFYPPLKAMTPDAACETVIAALRKAVALLK